MGLDDIEVTDAKVTYTTKELLRRIDDRFDRLERAYAEQPTRGEFDKVVARVVVLEDKEIATSAIAKALKDNSATTFSKRDRVLFAAIALLALAVQVYTATGGH